MKTLETNDPGMRRLRQLAAAVAVKDAKVTAPGEILPGVAPIWFNELDKMELPPLSWLIDGLVPACGITIIAAPPAQFKTWIAFEIALNIADGTDLFGEFKTKQAKVLIVDEESGLSRTRERMRLLGAVGSTQLAVTSYNNFKLDDENAKSLIKWCQEQKIELVVFDSLTRIHIGDENSSKDMSAVMGNLKMLVQAGIAVFLIHHNKKPTQFSGGGGNEMRGSSDILAACDVQLSVSREIGTNVVTVLQYKNRDGDSVKPFKFELKRKDHKVRFDYLGDAPNKLSKAVAAEATIIQLLTDNEQLNQTEIVTAMAGQLGEKAVAARLNLMVKQNKIHQTNGIKHSKIFKLPNSQADG